MTPHQLSNHISGAAHWNSSKYRPKERKSYLFKVTMVNHWQFQPNTMLPFPLLRSSSSTLHIHSGSSGTLCSKRSPLGKVSLFLCNIQGFNDLRKNPENPSQVATLIRHEFGTSHDFPVRLAEHFAPVLTVPQCVSETQSTFRGTPRLGATALVL